MAKANCNWWQYSRYVYNVGRTVKYLGYSDAEKEAVIEFIESIMESREALVPRIRLKYRNPVDDLTKQNEISLGEMLKLIGRNLKVEAPTEEEKEACDVLFEATGDRKIKIVKLESEDGASDSESSSEVADESNSESASASETPADESTSESVSEDSESESTSVSVSEG